MRTLLGAALAAGAAMTGAAHAQEFSANVSLTSDYVFRGVSLSDNGPAIQGGFDYSYNLFYAGVWASNVTEGVEIDLYAGVTPTTGPVEWDLGVIGYFYPGADDDIPESGPGADDAVGEFDYFEFMVAPSIALSEQVSLGAGLYYAPENYGETGNALYLEVNGGFTVSDQLEFTAAFGNQSIDDLDGPNSGSVEDDYNTWNIGGTYALHGFELDLRYHDTDIEAGSDIEAYTYGPSSYDGAVVLTIGREL